jgi:hypothetical protein
VATPPVAGLHLQFGADAASKIVVSWYTLQPVRNPRVVLGQLDGRLEQAVVAKPTGKPMPSQVRLSMPIMPSSNGCSRLCLSIRSNARRRRTGIRYVPNLSAGAGAVHLHQLRRPTHTDPRQEVRICCAASGIRNSKERAVSWLRRLLNQPRSENWVVTPFEKCPKQFT